LIAARCIGRWRVARVGAALLCFSTALPSAAAPQPTRYLGMCDASAAVAVGDDAFVAASDESNTLLLYRRGEPRPVGSFDVATFLRVAKKQEVDIEAAAAIGARVYWITSHSRNSKGKGQTSRSRLFATQLQPNDAIVTVGAPYLGLLGDLEAAPALARYGLAEAARLPAEAPGGLNIEGLAATADGQLLIGLRNPLHEGRALIIPLRNPAEVIDGARAKLAAPFELDLGGRGVRSIERIGGEYLIVAGPTADSGTFALYRWSGTRGEGAAPIAGIDLGTLRPEALYAVPQTHQLELLSDDGGIVTDGERCKDMPVSRQAFRGLIVTP
jgi:hypothetical protein